jgi:hypothetical protein
MLMTAFDPGIPFPFCEGLLALNDFRHGRSTDRMMSRDETVDTILKELRLYKLRSALSRKRASGVDEEEYSAHCSSNAGPAITKFVLAGGQ